MPEAYDFGVFHLDAEEHRLLRKMGFPYRSQHSPDASAPVGLDTHRRRYTLIEASDRNPFVERVIEVVAGFARRPTEASPTLPTAISGLPSSPTPGGHSATGPSHPHAAEVAELRIVIVGMAKGVTWPESRPALRSSSASQRVGMADGTPANFGDRPTFTRDRDE
jgi:hypothetical protein